MCKFKIILPILCLIQKIVQGQDPSPCPEIFNFEPRSFQSDRWYGVIKLTSKDTLEGIRLMVAFDNPTNYLGNWFGDCLTMNNKKYLIRNPEYIMEKNVPLSVRFFIEYNPDGPIPSVTQINLNGKIVCLKKHFENGPTTPKLHISLFIPSKTRSNFEESSSIESNALYTSDIPTTTTPRSRNNFNINELESKYKEIFLPNTNFNLNVKPSVINKQNIECGTIENQVIPLITYGHNTIKGQWPWHAALYVNKKYTCGGTLITEKHILTAGQCTTIFQTNIVINPQLLIVALGKHSLNKSDPDEQLRQVDEIFLHPEYNSNMFYNDIAILKVNESFEFNNFVRPCCLWEGDINYDNIVNKFGTVVGWGYNENFKFSDTLMQTKMPTIKQIECIHSNSQFYGRFTFEKNFCADTGVCNGDSGGAMVFPKSRTVGNTVWQIRGIVSVSVPLAHKPICDPLEYTVFTDVAKYLDWIQKTIK